MRNNKRLRVGCWVGLACMVSIALTSGTAMAFETMRIQGKSFQGSIISPPLNVLQSQSSRMDEMPEVARFFRRFYRANTTGNRQKIINMWALDERRAVSSILSQSKADLYAARFSAVQSFDLMFVADYKGYLVCWLSPTFAGFPAVPIKYVLKKRNNRFYMTNDLGQDPYLDQIMPVVDRRGRTTLYSRD